MLEGVSVIGKKTRILIVQELQITPWFVTHTKCVVIYMHDYGRKLANNKVESMSVDATVITHFKKQI